MKEFSAEDLPYNVTYFRDFQNLAKLKTHKNVFWTFLMYF